MDVLIYFSKNASYFGIGLLLALLISEASGKVIDVFNSHWISNLFIHLFMTISVLFTIEKWISPNFAHEWQANTPGILFTFGLFGGQLFNVESVGQNIKNAIKNKID